MRRLLSLFAVSVLVAACGGSGAASVPTAAGQPAGETTSPGATGSTGNGNPGGRPSGAKVRIVNVYNGGSTAPSIDLYAAPWVDAGATPFLTVPYGTATDFFDPTVADEQGDMFLSFYRHGQTGNGTALIDQTETLKGGEIITYVLMSDAETREDGTPKLYLQSLYHSPTSGQFDPTAAPGKGTLIVNMHAIEPAVAAPDGTSWYLSAGKGCTKSINDSADTVTAAGPGDGTTYVLDPGDYTLSLYPSTPDAFPDCSTAALISGIKVTIAPNTTSVLVVYAPTANDIKAMALPLGW